MTFSNKSLNKEKIGKRVMDDLYVHADYADRFLIDPEIINLIEIGRRLMSEEVLVCCNVIKINLRKQRLSFLQYFEFDHDPFPSLHGSFVIDPIKKTVTHRSYSSSLNPPILHRKELLVSQDHPNRLQWEQVTKNAEELGFFSTSSPIGFRENWIRIIAEKGFKLIGHSFVPLGNEVAEENAKKNYEEISQIQRHLTALSRSTISAPIQLLLGHGLINSSDCLYTYRNRLVRLMLPRPEFK
jgi:DNA phosphorothioation-associated putative methyltransferase